MKPMKNKLNSMRLLEQHQIPYEVVEFDDSLRDAEVIAESLGIPPYMVYKTLVAEPEGGGKPLLSANLKIWNREQLVSIILDGVPGTPMPPWRALISEADAQWIAERLQEGNLP